MNSAWVYGAVASHLGQSSLFAAVAGALTLLVRRNSARVRYCLWLAASVKFLVPFAALSAAGALIPWPQWASQEVTAAGQPALLTSLTLGAAGGTLLSHEPERSGLMLQLLGVLWLLGVITVAGFVLARWMRIAQVLRVSEPATVEFVIPVRWCAAHLGPVVVGIIRPVLLLPKGIGPRLTPEHLQAVLAHERCHVAWRDNLAAALHMLAASIFWFHPVIWWLGWRLIEERERACDEDVLSGGHQPEIYAEGILAVCEHHIQSRLACAAGAGGANLRKRIEAIMNNRMIDRLSGIQKVVLAVAAGAAIAVPIGAGLLSSRPAHAQGAAPGTPAPAVRESAMLGAGFPQSKDFYPATAQRLGESGRVVVRACVGAKGRLTAAPQIATTSGSVRLDHAALKLAKAGDGNYEPASENREPVESCFEFPVTFALISVSAPENHAVARSSTIGTTAKEVRIEASPRP